MKSFSTSFKAFALVALLSVLNVNAMETLENTSKPVEVGADNPVVMPDQGQTSVHVAESKSLSSSSVSINFDNDSENIIESINEKTNLTEQIQNTPSSELLQNTVTKSLEKSTSTETITPQLEQNAANNTTVTQEKPVPTQANSSQQPNAAAQPQNEEKKIDPKSGMSKTWATIVGAKKSIVDTISDMKTRGWSQWTSREKAAVVLGGTLVAVTAAYLGYKIYKSFTTPTKTKVKRARTA